MTNLPKHLEEKRDEFANIFARRWSSDLSIEGQDALEHAHKTGANGMYKLMHEDIQIFISMVSNWTCCASSEPCNCQKELNKFKAKYGEGDSGE